VISEATVIAVAATIYLFDCVVLLERGQGLWRRGGMSFGSRHYQLRGKVVALLNPLAPFVPVLRTRPLFSAPSAPKASVAARALGPLAAPVLLQFCLVFVALPWCLYRAPGWPFFAVLVLAYLNALALLVFIWWRFRRAGLAARPLAALGFAWLACLPLSVNAQRKAGLAFDVALDARQAIRALPAAQRARARGDLAAQVAEAMQDLDECDERHRRLAELRRRLEPEAGDGRA
jgi:hypothetical protein